MHVSSCRRKTWPVSTSTFRQSKHGTLRLAHDPPTLSILSSLIITRQNVVWFTQSSICCNDRFRANSCSTARSLLRLQSNAASAIAATAQVRFVPRCSHLQRSSPVSAARTLLPFAKGSRMAAFSVSARASLSRARGCPTHRHYGEAHAHRQAPGLLTKL